MTHHATHTAAPWPTLYIKDTPTATFEIDEEPLLTFEFDAILPSATDKPQVTASKKLYDDILSQVVDGTGASDALDALQTDIVDPMLDDLPFEMSDLAKPTPFSEDVLDAIIFGKPFPTKTVTATKTAVPLRRRQYRRLQNQPRF